jgi:GT2 family glycosyltransferase
MPPDPRFSVVIPTRHRNELLAQCLDRLAPGKQTMDASEYEVLVTDDGMTSTAEDLVQRDYPWVRWVAGPRRGPAANRNHAARLVRGQWIVFTDDDCLPARDWLEAYRSAIEPGIDVYEGKTTSAPLGLLEEAPVNLTGGCLWSCNFAIPAEVFQVVGGFDESFKYATCEDIDLHGRLRRAGYGFKFVEGAIVEHPPRRRLLGFNAGQRWESRVQLWYKEGNKRSTWTWLPVQLLKVRAREILRYPPNKRTIPAIWSAAMELAYVLTHLQGWSGRHRSAASGSS